MRGFCRYYWYWFCRYYWYFVDTTGTAVIMHLRGFSICKSLAYELIYYVKKRTCTGTVQLYYRYQYRYRWIRCTGTGRNFVAHIHSLRFPKFHWKYNMLVKNYNHANFYWILLTENHVYRKPRLLTSFSIHIINARSALAALQLCCAHLWCRLSLSRQ